MKLRRIAYAALAVALSSAAYFGAPTVAASVETYMAAPATEAATVKVILTNGHGSGVHIGNGFVVTAAHVAGDAATVELKTKDGKIRPADVLWVNKTYDIALLRTSPEMLPAAHLDCRTVSAGTVIEAIGNPLSVEFISAYGKIAGAPRAQGPWKSVFVTDITTVQGQSGGPVFGPSGDLIGITVGVMGVPMGFSASLVGYGFVVPSTEVCALLGRMS
ncbi:trypsin-like peptidase domain-containing protein [Neorhizobium sp. LMR1-1-1.1]